MMPIKQTRRITASWIHVATLEAEQTMRPMLHTHTHATHLHKTRDINLLMVILGLHMHENERDNQRYTEAVIACIQNI